MMGWRDIFAQRVHEAPTGQVDALAHAQTHTHIHAEFPIGALTHARTATAYADSKSFLRP